MADEWENLDQLRQQWKELFGEEFVFSPWITPDDMPLILQCIDEQSQKPLERHLEKLAEEGIVL